MTRSLRIPSRPGWSARTVELVDADREAALTIEATGDLDAGTINVHVAMPAPAGMTNEQLAAAGWDVDNPFGGDPDYLPELPEPTIVELQAAGVRGRVAALDSRIRAGRRLFARGGADLARAAYALKVAAEAARVADLDPVARALPGGADVLGAALDRGRPGGALAYAAEGLARMATTGEGVEPGTLIEAADHVRRLASDLVRDPGIVTPVDVEHQAIKVRRLAGDVEATVEDVAGWVEHREGVVMAVLG